MSNLYYFASDGSYGQWDALAILTDVSEWTSEDWQEVEEAGDSYRASVAESLWSTETAGSHPSRVAPCGAPRLWAGHYLRMSDPHGNI